MLVLKLAISGGLIFYLISTGKLPLEDLGSLLNPSLAAWGLLCIGLTLFIASERWRLLMRSQGIETKSYLCFKLTLIGVFFSFFLPGGVGGDVVKGYYVLQKFGGKKTHVIGSVLFDRLIGLFTMTIFCITAVLVSDSHLFDSAQVRPLIFLVGFLFFGFFSLFLGLWSRKFSIIRNFVVELSKKLPFAHRNIERLLSFKLTRKQFFQIVGLSLLTQTCNFALFFGLPQFLGYNDVPWMPLLFAVPLGFIATAVPISPGGVGVGQAAFFFLYNLVLQKDAQLGSVSVTLFQAFLIFYGLIGALFYLSMGRPQRIDVD